jgi:hypothetical protein
MPKKLTLKERVEAVAAWVGGTVYENYSGRFMFGDTCYGVVCEPFTVKDAIKQGNKRRLGTARTDNLGLDMIVYWPDARE